MWRRNRKPDRYADEGRMRTYRIVSYRSHGSSMEDDSSMEEGIRLMGSLHASKQPSHVLFRTTKEGLVEQNLTTDMPPPYMGHTVIFEDITPDPLPEQLSSRRQFGELLRLFFGKRF